MSANSVTNPSGAEKKTVRVLVLFGSPKREGNTGALLDAFLRELPTCAEVEEFHCFTTPLAPCDGCSACETTGRCRYSDADALWAKLRQADVLVVATPLYFLSFPAPLKAVVDRMQMFWSIRFVQGVKPVIEKAKNGVLLVTGGADGDGVDLVRRQTRMFFSLLHTKLVAEAVWTHIDNGNGPEQAMEAARKAAEISTKRLLEE